MRQPGVRCVKLRDIAQTDRAITKQGTATLMSVAFAWPVLFLG